MIIDEQQENAEGQNVPCLQSPEVESGLHVVKLDRLRPDRSAIPGAKLSQDIWDNSQDGNSIGNKMQN